ncbi:YybH family protein [uncultured Fibrella sp.]|uniref:YybH family protein n=1 Tax=uncultured Fibrella sp. TaxID=1284596 RepID=UPI0035CC95F3
MKLRLLLFVCLSMSGISLAQPSADQQIRAIRQQFNEAIARHDTTHLASFFTDDYTLLSARNTEAKGKEGGKRALANAFRTQKNVVYVRTPTQIDVFASWHMASETGRWTGTWQETDGTVMLTGTYLAKWHQINGQWALRAEVFTPLTCSGSSYCEKGPGVK